MKNAHKKIRDKTIAPKNKKTKNGYVQKTLAKAQHYFAQNQLQQANCLFQEVLQQQPENITALHALADIACQINMFSVATEILNAASAMLEPADPQYLVVHKRLAQLYTKMARYDDAIVQYRILLSMDKKNNDSHNELSKLQTLAKNMTAKPVVNAVENMENVMNHNNSPDELHKETFATATAAKQQEITACVQV